MGRHCYSAMVFGGSRFHPIRTWCVECDVTSEGACGACGGGRGMERAAGAAPARISSGEHPTYL